MIDDHTHPTYKKALGTAIDNAERGHAEDDYYQVRDNNNGWDIFHYGYQNRNSTDAKTLKKKAHAEIVIDGWHGDVRVLFNAEDSFKILTAVRQYGNPIQFKLKRWKAQRESEAIESHSNTCTC